MFPSGRENVRVRGPIVTLAGLGAGLAAYGWFEAGWMRLKKRDVGLRRLPQELRRARDPTFHFGLPSRGTRAVRQAVEWVEERQSDPTMISGNLLSRRSGESLFASYLFDFRTRTQSSEIMTTPLQRIRLLSVSSSTI
jgi:hypothetical protein